MSKTIGLIINSDKQQAVDLGREICAWGERRGADILCTEHSAEALNSNGAAALSLNGTAALNLNGVSAPDGEWLRRADAALVIGGDGTFLRAGRFVIDHDIPLYGINLGRLGFLTYGKPSNAFKDLERILEGDYTVFERPTIFGEVIRGGGTVLSYYALNELVLIEGVTARLLRVDVFFNGRKLGELSADGVIVASPTGSTAYSLSAGGPIVPPHIACMIFAPICAHTLYARPIIAGAEDEITLVPRGSSQNILLSYDGQLASEIMPGDTITAKLSTSKTIKSIQMRDRSFLDLIHEKLGWGQSFISEDKE